MAYSPKLRSLLLDIIKYGILEARMCSWRSNCEAAAHEVDHIHNLPDALKTEEYHRIRYYLDVEWECYWKNKHRENRQKIEGLWAELDEEVAAGGADVK